MVLSHPYGVDEALDSVLFAMGEACRAGGRSDLAIAINETGWLTWDTATGWKNYGWLVSEEEQARNIVKLHVQSLAHRVSFVAVLNWNDFGGKSDQARNMGLVRMDGSPKPSYHAYWFMTRTIGRRRVDEWTYDRCGARVYRFTGDPPLWVVRNAIREAAVTVDTGATEVFVLDICGVKRTVLPAKGKVTVRAGDGVRPPGVTNST